MPLNSEPFWNWVNERHAIWHRRRMYEENVILPAGVPVPEPFGTITEDPILAEFRFCNVFRELDRVTRWIDENIRKPYADHPNLWLMLAIARTINWPNTLEYVMKHHEQRTLLQGGWPTEPGFNPVDLGRVLYDWQIKGNKVFTGAYVIRAESQKEFYWCDWPKVKYVAEIVIGLLWKDREKWEKRLRERCSLEETWKYFLRVDENKSKKYIGWGPFMSYQVIVDLRHTRYLRDAPDINTWSSLGPGSRRGLNRLAGRDPTFPLSQREGLQEMLELYAEQDEKRASWVPHIDLSDIQNCLCETDKWLRVKNGEGRPRARYVQGRGW